MSSTQPRTDAPTVAVKNGTGTPNIAGCMGMTSANSLETTGGMTPADTLGEPKRMTQDTPDEVISADKGESWLREKYHTEKLSTVDIGELLDVYPSTISDWLNNHGIETRDKSEAASRGALGDKVEKLKDADWLREQYHDEARSSSDIADDIGCDSVTVREWMERHGIERRPPGGRNGPHHHSWNDNLNSVCEICGGNFRKRKVADVGRFCSKKCYGVAKSQKIRGEAHPNWNGGYKDYYGPNWPEQQEKARARDNYTCQRCGMGSSTHHEKYGCELHIHHIINKNNFEDYEKMNLLSNLITLCSSCHKLLEGLPIDNGER